MTNDQKKPVLIVDGHSMIFQWPDLAAHHLRNPVAARAELVRILDTLRDNSGRHVIVVFDGKGVRPNEAGDPGRVQIFYSKAGQTADSIIERLVAKYGATYDVTVATDDRLEQTTVATFGGTPMSSEALRNEIADAGRQLAERIKQLRRAR